MLTIARVELPERGDLQVGLDTSQLTKMLEEQAPRLARQPENAVLFSMMRPASLSIEPAVTAVAWTWQWRCRISTGPWATASTRLP
jgi:hypothetical protein